MTVAVGSFVVSAVPVKPTSVVLKIEGVLVDTMPVVGVPVDGIVVVVLPVF